MTKRVIPFIVFMSLLLIGFVGTAFAASAIAPDDQSSLLDFIRPAYDAIMAGHYMAGAALALVFALAAFKRYAPGKLHDFAVSDAGGALCALGISFFGAVATATMAGEGWGGLSVDVAIMSGKVAFMAAGGYVLIKKLIVVPLMESNWYQTKAPGWLKSVITIVLWAFMSKSIEEKTDEVGAEALKDNPSAGANGVVGSPEQF